LLVFPVRGGSGVGHWISQAVTTVGSLPFDFSGAPYSSRSFPSFVPCLPALRRWRAGSFRRGGAEAGGQTEFSRVCATGARGRVTAETAPRIGSCPSCAALLSLCERGDLLPQSGAPWGVYVRVGGWIRRPLTGHDSPLPLPHLLGSGRARVTWCLCAVWP